MIPFALRLVRPYWKWLLIVVVAMIIDTAMGLASPWPLKIVLASVFDAQADARGLRLAGWCRR
ncbi:MAG: hypothetical protein ABIX28_26390 [Vicinamibacterales bacterium]